MKYSNKIRIKAASTSVVEVVLHLTNLSSWYLAWFPTSYTCSSNTLLNTLI